VFRLKVKSFAVAETMTPPKLSPPLRKTFMSSKQTANRWWKSSLF